SDLAPDDPRRALLEKVEKQTFRASRIVSSLLDFARRPGVERQPVDLRPLIEETIELVRERLATHSVTLDWAAPTTDPRVLGSAGELQQVVTNLILNAIDALAPGGEAGSGCGSTQRLSASRSWSKTMGRASRSRCGPRSSSRSLRRAAAPEEPGSGSRSAVASSISTEAG